MEFIIPFESEQGKDIAKTGGKGRNLSILFQSNEIKVPPGFTISAEAYSLHEKDTEGLADFIKEHVTALVETGDESHAKAIRTKFMESQPSLDDGLRHSILESYSKLGGGSVAVRSSATAEDLPTLSFAGQQESVLNVVGETQLVEAVLLVWASLWTARAIQYRAFNEIPSEGLAVAVVVQCMIPCDAAGVLFTANPLSGRKTETVIDATTGLGEAIVSGQVEPDHFVLCTLQQPPVILEQRKGAKQLVIRPVEGGGISHEAVEVEVPSPAANEKEPAQVDNGKWSITPEQAVALAKVGSEIAALDELSPGNAHLAQDIEWGIHDGTIHIFQARPITSLYPVSAEMARHEDENNSHVYQSFGIKQGFLDPMTLTGMDAVIEINRAWVEKQFSMPMTYMARSGLRLWSDITPLFRNNLVRKQLIKKMDTLEPTVQAVYGELIDDERVCPTTHRTSTWKALKIGFRLRDMMWLVLKMGKNPDLVCLNDRCCGVMRTSQRIMAGMNETLRQKAEEVDAMPPEQWRQALISRVDLVLGLPAKFGDGFMKTSLALIMAGYGAMKKVANAATSIPGFKREVDAALAEVDPGVKASPAVPGEQSDESGGRLTDEEALSLLTAGAPHNPTTEMDLYLWEIGTRIYEDAPSRALFLDKNNIELAEMYTSGSLPPASMAAVKDFLDKYGFRGYGEIDAGRPRWVHEPERVMATIKGYQLLHESQKDDSNGKQKGSVQATPDVLFKKGGEEADLVYKMVLERVPSSKRRSLAKNYLCGRSLVGMRECPKYYLVKSYGIAHQILRAIGTQLVSLGVMTKDLDAMMVSWSELRELADRCAEGQDDFTEAEQQTWKDRIKDRWLEYDRELHRKQIPNLMCSDGRVFHRKSLAQAGDNDGKVILRGFAVSVGTLEGTVRVVNDPAHDGQNLKPGEIMVCRATDPSWTPLFLTCGGLIMEMGSMMTHGSVVAREYGIPAVVGVENCVEIMRTGQRVMLDGTSGTITLLDDIDMKGGDGEVGAGVE